MSKKEIRKELETTIDNQLELIELGDFQLAQEIEQDIIYLKTLLGQTCNEFETIIMA